MIFIWIILRVSPPAPPPPHADSQTSCPWPWTCPRRLAKNYGKEIRNDAPLDQQIVVEATVRWSAHTLREKKYCAVAGPILPLRLLRRSDFTIILGLFWDLTKWPRCLHAYTDRKGSRGNRCHSKPSHCLIKHLAGTTGRRRIFWQESQEMQPLAAFCATKSDVKVVSNTASDGREKLVFGRL